MRAFLTFVFVAYAVPSPLAAQTAAEACAALSRITVGQWAEYKLTGQESAGVPSQIRFAIVGTEAVTGKEHYWHEMKMETGMGTMIIQVLVPGYPYDQVQIQGAIMKMGDQPAMRMPAQMLGMMQSQGGDDLARDIAQKCGEAETVGWESVTVPAGTFRALHLRTTDDGDVSEVWISTDIPFGMVKLSGPQGTEMLLLGQGKDATSSITEKPQGMPGGHRP